MITLKEIGAGVNIGVNIEVNKSEIPDITVNNISTDTRTIKKGDFYLPLKGENFDGEKFIDKALEAGAIGYCYTQTPSDKDVVGFKVNDTKEAYLRLANFYRRKINPKVIMITGSSGKTTTKELVYSVVSQKYKTIKTDLNHNNEIGFCQTVFSMNEDTEVLIIEAGMRGLGEIELISKYAQPDISIISNVGTAHIGRLGSRENIAKAKCEITKYQNNNGILIAHNDELIKQTTDFKGEKVYYSIDDVKIVEKLIGFSEFKYNNELYELKVEGDYNIENALSAIITGKYLGIDYELIKKGLFDYQPIEKRWQIETVGGYKIINDSYNANPESMKATLGTISELYPNSIVVLGDMGELGDKEVYYHEEIGKFMNGKSASMVLTVGNLANNISKNMTSCFTKNFLTTEDVAKYIVDNIKEGSIIFLKASRSMKFENIIETIKSIKGENK